MKRASSISSSNNRNNSRVIAQTHDAARTTGSIRKLKEMQGLARIPINPYRPLKGFGSAKNRKRMMFSSSSEDSGEETKGRLHRASRSRGTRTGKEVDDEEEEQEMHILDSKLATPCSSANLIKSQLSRFQRTKAKYRVDSPLTKQCDEDDWNVPKL